jgi:hypothetical protein
MRLVLLQMHIAEGELSCTSFMGGLWSTIYGVILISIEGQSCVGYAWHVLLAFLIAKFKYGKSTSQL